MNQRHSVNLFPFLAALALVGFGAAGYALGNRDHPTPASGYSVYDHPEEYWVFQHRDDICANARKLLDDNDSTLRDVIDANVVTFDESGDVTSEEAQQYLRGLLTGCINY